MLGLVNKEYLKNVYFRIFEAKIMFYSYSQTLKGNAYWVYIFPFYDY